MPWFKNLMIYRLTTPLENLSQRLQTALPNEAFTPCLQSEMSKMGWVKPLKNDAHFYFNQGNNFLLHYQREDKILPANVIQDALNQRIAEQEEKEARQLKKAEKQALKEDIIATLLPRAFSKCSRLSLWIDSENQFIYINTSSSKRAEKALGLLRKTLGSLPVVPLCFNNEIGQVTRQWLLTDHVPSWATILEEMEMKGGIDDAVIRCKQQDLTAPEILAFLESGKTIAKLALDWQENLSFILKEDGTLQRLKFASVLLETNQDIDKRDQELRLNADFTLMTTTLKQLTEHLLDAFGGEKARL